MENITFDKAIEILEIIDISKVSINSLSKVRKKALKRWHPDKVAYKKNSKLTEEYNYNSQLVEPAIELLHSYLKGTYNAGDAFGNYKNPDKSEPEEKIRKNAPNMQETLTSLWDLVKKKKYKWEEKIVNLSNGFKLKDLLKEDFEDDISATSIISIIYGTVFAMIISIIWSIVSIWWIGGEFMVKVVGISWLLFVISNFIMFLPLSRFWLPEKLQNILIKSVETGIGYADWTDRNLNWGFLSIVALLISGAIKFIVLYPIYEISKLIVGDKIVGVVNKNVDYYANLAEWYIDELLTKNPNLMSKEELYHLSHLYSELKDVNSKT